MIKTHGDDEGPPSLYSAFPAHLGDVPAGHSGSNKRAPSALRPEVYELIINPSVVRNGTQSSAARTTNVRRTWQRGAIEQLPSGALRVKVFAGDDPLTGRRHYLRETVPAGPTAAREAEKVRTRLLNQVDEGRNSRTNATVNELMDRYLELLDVDTTTRTGEHDCDEHCTMEPSEGLSSSSIRQIHWCLSGALNRAVRWRWIVVNPLGQAESPAAVKPDPHPPAPDQAASIVNEAFRDLPWGVLVWLAMVTGARRGELCDALGLARPGQHGDSITNE